MVMGIVGFYFLAMFAIGIVASRKIASSGDYYLGGKSFGPWFTAFKFASTWESGTKLVGTPGMAWNVGWAAFVQGMATPLCYFFSFRVFGQRLKRACDKFNVITVPQLLEKRYSSKTVRVLGAITILVGLGGSLVAQYKATGEIFSSVLGMTYVQGLFIGVLVVGIYSILGGYLASVWTDFVQGIVMAIGSIIIFVAAIRASFGTFTLNFIPRMNEALAQANPSMLEITAGGKMPWTQIVVILTITLLVGIALPQQSVAIFSMRDVRVARSALIICVMFSAILAWCLLPSGMMGRIILETSQVQNPDMVIPLMINTILHPVLAGIFIAAILSAIMSTVDGAIMVAASALTQDILNIVAPEVYQKNQVFWDRLAAAFFVLIPLLLAIKPPTIIFWIAVFSFGFMVFTFLMPMLGVVFIKKATTTAVIVQMLVTMTVIPFWSIMGSKIYPKAPALLVGLILAPIVFFAVNMFTKQHNPETVEDLWASYKGL